MADTTAATGLGSLVPKPQSSFLDEYERQMAQKKAMAPTVFQQNYDAAAGRLASIAQGQPSPAVQAAQQASRETLARQAGNLRSTMAQATAASGSLGQGAGMRAAAATEQGILGKIADSRLSERQAIAQEAMDANSQLASGAQADRTYDFQKQNQQQQLLGTLLDKGTASQQMEAQAGLQGLAGITPNPKADEINKAAYLEATNSPEYLAQQAAAKKTQMDSEDALKTSQFMKQVGDRTLTSSSSGYRSTGYTVNAKPGEIVNVDGKPMQFLRKELIDTKTGGIQRGFEDYNLHRFVFQDPVTGQIINKDEKWGSVFE